MKEESPTLQVYWFISHILINNNNKNKISKMPTKLNRDKCYKCDSYWLFLNLFDYNIFKLEGFVQS